MLGSMTLAARAPLAHRRKLHPHGSFCVLLKNETQLIPTSLTRKQVQRGKEAWHYLNTCDVPGALYPSVHLVHDSNHWDYLHYRNVDSEDWSSQ